MTKLIQVIAPESAPAILPIKIHGGRVHLFIEGSYKVDEFGSNWPAKGEMPLCGRKSTGVQMTHPKVTHSAIYDPKATANFVDAEIRIGHTHQTFACKGCAKAYVELYGAPQRVETAC